MLHLIVNADIPAGKLSRHLQGHFAEHLGRCIYNGLYVGPESPIPNLRGIRSDLVQALREIQAPVIRWPGGCFADEYHWQDGIGAKEKRPSMVNVHWGGVTENNHFGTHEFFDLCEQIGAEPYICGNVGSGTVREMRDWIEYMTIDGLSPMANLRRANGQEAPFALTYFGVGNENWGCGGQMRPEFYADQYRRYAGYCRDYGQNQLFRIACGANADDYRWTEVLMRECAPLMDGLSLHYYTVAGPWEDKGSATAFDERDWFLTMRNAARMDELIAKHGTRMDLYDPQKRVALVVDEWGCWWNVEPGTNPGFLYQQNTMRDAVVAGMTLNIFNRHCDRVRMANIAQTINVLQAVALTEGARMLKTPTWYAFNLFKAHQDATMVHLYGETGATELDGERLPQLSISASVRGGRLTLTPVNVSYAQPLEISVQLRGCGYRRAEGRLLAGEPQAHNTFDEPERVIDQPFEVYLKGDVLRFTLPPASLAAVTLS